MGPMKVWHKALEDFFGFVGRGAAPGMKFTFYLLFFIWKRNLIGSSIPFAGDYMLNYASVKFN